MDSSHEINVHLFTTYLPNPFKHHLFHNEDEVDCITIGMHCTASISFILFEERGVILLTVDVDREYIIASWIRWFARVELISWVEQVL